MACNAEAWRGLGLFLRVFLGDERMIDHAATTKELHTDSFLADSAGLGTDEGKHGAGADQRGQDAERG
jgi:hypothetical protein